MASVWSTQTFSMKLLSPDDVFITMLGRNRRASKRPWRVEFVQAVERRRRQHMDSSTVKERSLGQTEIGDSVSEVEPFDIWPVLFGIGRTRTAEGQLTGLAAVDRAQCHLTSELRREDPVEITLLTGYLWCHPGGLFARVAPWPWRVEVR